MMMMRGSDDDVERGNGAPLVWCTRVRAQRHVLKIREAITEAYSPGRIWEKLLPVMLLRLAKAAAVVVNAPFGHLFLGWQLGESRLLDFVGKETHALFGQIYGRELSREESIAFLNKRLYYCLVTATCTVLQIAFSYAQLHFLTLTISFLLLPLLLDRQWATLITRMQSRYDRSQVARLSKHLDKALTPLATATGVPTRFGLRGLELFLGGVEMCVGAAQFACGALILAYTVSRVVRPLEEVDSSLVASMAALRVVKELANVLSPCIEQRRQPAQFDRNEDCVRQVLHALTAVAASPLELALLIHEQPEAEGEFMLSCKVLAASCVCGSRQPGDRAGGKTGLMALLGAAHAGDGQGGGEADLQLLRHSHGSDCLPAFVRGRWRSAEQEAMLGMMLEAGQAGACWWSKFHDGHPHRESAGRPPDAGAGGGGGGSAGWEGGSWHEEVQRGQEHHHWHEHHAPNAREGGRMHQEGGFVHYHKHKHTLPNGTTFEHSHVHCHPDPPHSHEPHEEEPSQAAIVSVSLNVELGQMGGPKQILQV